MTDVAVGTHGSPELGPLGAYSTPVLPPGTNYPAVLIARACSHGSDGLNAKLADFGLATVGGNASCGQAGAFA